MGVLVLGWEFINNLMKGDNMTNKQAKSLNSTINLDTMLKGVSVVKQGVTTKQDGRDDQKEASTYDLQIDFSKVSIGEVIDLAIRAIVINDQAVVRNMNHDEFKELDGTTRNVFAGEKRARGGMSLKTLTNKLAGLSPEMKAQVLSMLQEKKTTK